MARKKVVFVIVEGPTDELTLGSLYDELFDNQQVFVDVMHCDILTDYLNNNKPFHEQRSANIKNEITNIVKSYAENNFLTKNHFLQVIHICDTDGCFISDDDVVEDSTVDKVIYSTTDIRCKNKNELLKYRKLKRENIEKLINTDKIWATIPYRLYFMSSSLDHVLYNELNSTDDEKEANASQFVQKYENNWNECVEYLSNSDFVVKGDFKQTWDYIKKEKHSLERNTNIYLSFPSSKNERN
jgi:hypothetical protein